MTQKYTQSRVEKSCDRNTVVPELPLSVSRLGLEV
jgi:hypothetical protein